MENYLKISRRKHINDSDYLVNYLVNTSKVFTVPPPHPSISRTPI